MAEKDIEDNVEEEMVFDEKFFESLHEQTPKTNQLNDFSQYLRPPLASNYQQEKHDFYFMQIDCDYYVGKQFTNEEEIGILRMYGVTKEGNSVLAHIHGFISYFYVEKPLELQSDANTLEHLRTCMMERGKAIRTIGNTKNSIVKIEVVKKESIKYFKGMGDSKMSFLKIYCSKPSFVSSYRNLFERDFDFGKIKFNNRTYESNMPYALRFMIDTKNVGMGWVKIPANRYSLKKEKFRMSRCQIELECSCNDIIALKPENEWSQIAPLRILSFDIECAAQKGFPTYEKDPVIQIAALTKVHNENTHFSKIIFTYKSCSNIADTDVRSFEKEEDMLLAWQEYIQAVDPDFIIGYNIINFDWVYIIERAVKKFKIKNFGYFGRILKSQTQIKEGQYLSKAMGMRDTKEINIDGRIQLDMMMHMHREHKLSSYSLNNVSFQFLKEQKEDVHYDIIWDLQNGTPDSRRRIAVYCLKDAYLPLKLMEKLMCIYNYTEMARVTGVPINFLFLRGQQIKVASQLYRKAAEVNMLIPTERVKSAEDKYEGAFVLEPKRDFYRVPIATLDFASLYPSIMMAHNLCYSTLIPNDMLNSLSSEDYTRTPRGDYFIKPHVRKGLLPIILEELLAARKKAKNELAVATDPFVKAVLDGRQLALKISANSVYGFTGAQIGQLPCLQISASVTAFGQEMIKKTRDMVLEKYSKKNGFEYDSEVIYGDTDSVMVKFGVSQIEEAMKLGKEAADFISRHFIKPIKLEFEKVYYPYMLFNRKRYAGVLWTKPEKYDKIDTKGIESVRRDNCALIRIMMNEILRKVLVERDEKGAVEYTKQIISDLLQNKIDLSLLVITKAITKKSEKDVAEEDQNNKNSKKEPKNIYKAKQAHVELAQRMKERDAGTAPSIGDRVAYVMVAGTKGSKNYENSEDPLYVLENDLPIDYSYYIEKQIKPPLAKIFDFIIPNANALYEGEHTKVQYIPKVNNKSTGLAKFAIVKRTCLGCKVPISDAESALCKHCLGKALDIYCMKIVEVNQLQKTFWELWTQCQRCQGSLIQEVICTNRDCPIFYKRKKIQNEIANGQKILDQFENNW